VQQVLVVGQAMQQAMDAWLAAQQMPMGPAAFHLSLSGQVLPLALARAKWRLGMQLRLDAKQQQLLRLWMTI
jgi:hypothetical protein